MLEKIKNTLSQAGIRLGDSKSLLACSGGMDSMALFHVLLGLKISFEVAHVNFGLRGVESDGDEKFVRELCHTHDIPCHILHADIPAFMQLHKVSTQVAAREIRYQYFKDIGEKNNLKYVLTAHHRSDAFENLFIYLWRNNLDAAFSGIPILNGALIRPLVNCTKEEIADFMLHNHFKFRQDSSNEDTKYLRNVFRNIFIPQVLEYNPALLQEFAELSSQFRGWAAAREKRYQKWYGETVRVERNGNLKVMYKEGEKKYAEMEQKFFRSLGFHPSISHKMASQAQTGNTFFVADKKVTKERWGWQVSKSLEMDKPGDILIETLPESVIFGDWEIQLHVVSPSDSMDSQAYFFDMRELKMPLLLRTRQNGDKISALGMQGRKLLSDVFVNAKISNADKARFPVLYDSEGILAVLGLQRSARATITPNTNNILKVTWQRFAEESD